jgi:hypothetical protein
MSIIPYGVVIYSKEVSNSKELIAKVSRNFLCNVRKNTEKPKESFVTAVGSITNMGIRKEQVKPFLF